MGAGVLKYKIKIAIGVSPNPEGGFQVETKAVGFPTEAAAELWAEWFGQEVMTHSANEFLGRERFDMDSLDQAIAASQAKNEPKQ